MYILELVYFQLQSSIGPFHNITVQYNMYMYMYMWQTQNSLIILLTFSQTFTLYKDYNFVSSGKHLVI